MDEFDPKLKFGFTGWKGLPAGGAEFAVVNSPPRRPEPNLGTAIPNVIERARKLLEWMPKGSAGSSGEMRRAAMEEAIEYLEAAWVLARL